MTSNEAVKEIIKMISSGVWDKEKLKQIKEVFRQEREDAYWRLQWERAIQDDNERLRANAGN